MSRLKKKKCYLMSRFCFVLRVVLFFFFFFLQARGEIVTVPLWLNGVNEFVCRWCFRSMMAALIRKIIIIMVMMAMTTMTPVIGTV